MHDEFFEALKAFCLSHGYEIAGTCEHEGIYGEISVKRVGDPVAWLDWDTHVFNFKRT